MWNILYKAVAAPLGVFKREEMKGRLGASQAVVLTTAVLGTVIMPALNYYINKSKYEISLDIGGILMALAVSILTWLAVCTLFWLLSKGFNKALKFGQVASIWGLSYIPNFLCIILYGLLSFMPGINNGTGFTAFVISALFITFLVWKVIYFFMMMRFVMDTTLRQLIVTTVVSAFMFTGLMYIGFRAGIQVPIL